MNKEAIKALAKQPKHKREVEQAMRLRKSVERLALQAGEETEETIDWLCGEYGGMFKLFQAYFSPNSAQRKPLTNAEIRKWWASENGFEDCNMAKLDDFEQVIRAVEGKHGIGEKGGTA